jgi:hypothetical protein
VRKITGPDFECIRKPDKKSVLKMAIQIPNRPVFGGVLYIYVYIYIYIYTYIFIVNISGFFNGYLYRII